MNISTLTTFFIIFAPIILCLLITYALFSKPTPEKPMNHEARNKLKLYGARGLTKIDFAVMGLIIAALVVGCYERNRVWRTEKSLWLDVIKKSPNKDRPYNNLAAHLLREHKPGDHNLREAKVYLEKAVSMPNFSQIESINNLAIIYGEEGNYEKAFEMLDKAMTLYRRLRKVPGTETSEVFRAEIENNLGLYMFKAGKLDEALYHIKECLKIMPDYDIARINFQNIIREKNRRANAKRG